MARQSIVLVNGAAAQAGAAGAVPSRKAAALRDLLDKLFVEIEVLGTQSTPEVLLVLDDAETRIELLQALLAASHDRKVFQVLDALERLRRDVVEILDQIQVMDSDLQQMTPAQALLLAHIRRDLSVLPREALAAVLARPDAQAELVRAVRFLEAPLTDATLERVVRDAGALLRAGLVGPGYELLSRVTSSFYGPVSVLDAATAELVPAEVLTVMQRETRADLLEAHIAGKGMTEFVLPEQVNDAAEAAFRAPLLRIRRRWERLLEFLEAP